MKKLFAAIRRAPKRTAGLLLVAAAVVIAPLALQAWGPDRPTYTYQKPAPHVTFNSMTNNPSVGDERNFVRIREAVTGATFGNDVQLQAGKTYEVMVYYHNNAAANLNDKIGNDGKSVGIARDVTARIQMPRTVKAGQTGTITGSISASNAKPGTVWDNTRATSASDVALRYVQGSAKIASSNGAVNGAALSTDLFTSGVKLGYNKLDGILPGCNEFAGYITYRFVVDKPDFTVKKQVSVDEGKTWGDTAKTTPGSTIQYRLIYQNTGTMQQDNVILRDELPAGVTYVPGSSQLATGKTGGAYTSVSDGITASGGYKIGSFAPKANAYFKFSAKVPANDKLAACGNNTLTNKGIAHTENGNKSDTATVTVTKDCPKNPGVSIDKTVDGKEHKDVVVGETFTYNLTVKNTGNVDLSNVVVTDNAPTNVQFISADKGTITDNKWSYTIPTLKIGASVTFNITAKVTAFVETSIKNTACVDMPNTPKNPDDCDDATVKPKKPSVSIDKKVDGVDSKEVVVGESFKYQLTVKNTGAVNLTNVKVADNAPEHVQFISADKGTIKDNKWGYTIPSLKVGERATFVITAKVTAYSKTAIVNTACVDAPEVPGNPDDCDDATVTPKKPGVSIKKTVDGIEHKKVNVNQEFTYQLVVKNTGDTTLKNVIVSDNAPEHVQFISADKGTIKDNKWGYVIPELKPGESTAFAIVAKVTRAVDGIITNTACVDAPAIPGMPDDCDDATVEVPPVTPEVPEIKVCDLTSKKIITIKKDQFDNKKHSKNLTKCAETPVITPDTPTELPTTGLSDSLMATIGLGSLVASIGYYVASRRSLGL